MENIILHIGYPKTGTTTLQNAWFYNLHTNNFIKYFGKCTHNNANSALGEQLLLRQFTNSKGKSFAPSLDNEVVNVFSDERICLPLVFKQNSPKYGRDTTNIFDSAKILSNVFKDYQNVSILITIRNQCDLINSMYAHYYYYLRTHDLYSNMSAFLNYILYESHILNFDTIAAHFAEVFGPDDVYILPFELLMQEPEQYLQSLSDVLQLPENILYESVDMGAHFNKSKSGNNVYIKRMGKIHFQYVRKFIDPIYPVVKMEEIAKSYLSDSFVDTVKQKFLTDVSVPSLDTAQRKIVTEHYNKSNLKLSNKYNITQDFLLNNQYLL
jgi:hypothetical protein